MRLIILAAILALSVPTPALASHPQLVRIASIDGAIDFALSGYDTAGGVNLAVADLGGDGIAEILAAGGLGSEPRVRVLRQDGSEIGSFLAYAPTLGVGIQVITCDLTGDGFPEIVTAPQRGGGPHVRVFDRMGQAIDSGGFFAYDGSMRAGVNLACGDLLGDQRGELVTLPAAGAGAHVRVWSWSTTGMQREQDFFAFDATDRTGLVGVVHDRQLIVAQQFTSSPIIKRLVIHSSPTVVSEKIFPINALGVRSLAVVDGNLYLSTATNGQLVNTRTGSVQRLSDSNVNVPIGTFSNRLIYTSSAPLFDETREAQRIIVDISNQRLYAYENGVLQNSFLISSGKNNATPLGNHTILAKVPFVHYTWNYGPGDPRNYDLGLVPYNLRFAQHIYIHYAYWHNNFGHPMSRGCVNVALEDMKWIYDWARVGASVVVQE